jgi:poly-gamma-glutamate synthesis protein (capsule biosynthesis protein)
VVELEKMIKKMTFIFLLTVNVSRGDVIKIFLAGDVMTGRGIDQILPNPVDPKIYEPYVKDAREYVKLAETASGPIPRKVSS